MRIIPSNNIVSLAQSSDSLVWALPKEGLSLVNYINGDIKNLLADDGINSFINVRKYKTSCLFLCEDLDLIQLPISCHYSKCKVLRTKVQQ